MCAVSPQKADFPGTFANWGVADRTGAPNAPLPPRFIALSEGVHGRLSARFPGREKVRRGSGQLQPLLAG